MQIRCDSCGAEVAAADVNLERMMAKCARCNSVFDVSAQTGGQRRARPVVPMPKRITVQSGEETVDGSYRVSSAPSDRFVIVRSWFSPMLFAMVVFCLFWDGFLILWYAAAGRSANIVALIFPILHVTVGVFITYSTICGFVNKTFITLAGGTLTVRHGPLPWWGNTQMAASDIEQIFCRQHIGNKGARTYRVIALEKGGAERFLLKDLPDAEQALFIEQALEARLGIIDVPVVGDFT